MTSVELEPQVLSLIFSHLGLEDIVNASQVCRKWYWRLWRENEQLVLWMPRIKQKLLSNSNQCASRLVNTVSDMFFNKELKGSKREDVIRTLNEIEARSKASVERIAKGLWISGRFTILFEGRELVMSTNDPRNGNYYFTTENRGEETDGLVTGAYYKVWWRGDTYAIVAFIGTWPANKEADVQTAIGELVSGNGDPLYNGAWSSVDGVPHGLGALYNEHSHRLMYSGEFIEGQPFGEGTFYRDDGSREYHGNWQNGIKVGEGTTYYEDGKSEGFVGTFMNSVPHTGTWKDPDGFVVHRGNVVELKQRFDDCYLKHRCTFGVGRKAYLIQKYFECKTCFPGDAIKGVCVSCADRCHKGHDLVARPEGPFFCDCGVNPDMCKALSEDCDPDSCGCKDRVAAEPAEPRVNGLHFIHDPNGRPLTDEEQQAYLIALMLELQGDGQQQIPFNGVENLNDEQRAMLLAEIEEHLAAMAAGVIERIPDRVAE